MTCSGRKFAPLVSVLLCLRSAEIGCEKIVGALAPTLVDFAGSLEIRSRLQSKLSSNEASLEGGSTAMPIKALSSRKNEISMAPSLPQKRMQCRVAS